MSRELSRAPGSGPREPDPDPVMTARAEALLRAPRVQGVVGQIRDSDDRTLRDQVQLTEIPAPPFGEAARAERMAELFEECGLERVRTDEEGNVLGWRERSTEPPLVVSAHLDTVFPGGTDVTVRREGDRLLGPGIGDDGRGLAALLALARTLTPSGLDTGGPLLFAATVGEEGAGDLRGVRHLFRDGGPCADARGFLSLDGAGTRRLVTTGLGSRRYRLRARGSGGHSWVDWGTPNPIHALARIVSGATDLPLPDDPATSLTAGRWSGGTSVNAIPAEAWVELEIRSEGADTLEELDREIRRLVEVAAAEVNGGRAPGTDPLEVAVDPIGHRPAGATPPDSILVRAAAAATRAVGESPELAVSSTDANVPMTLGVPALTMGAGGEGGAAHTTDEWYRNVKGPDGIVRALLTLLLAGDPPG